MPTMTEQQIQAVFDRLGIGTEEDRRRLRNLAKPVPISDELHTPILLDAGSLQPLREKSHAKLAPTPERDQG